MTQEIRMLKTTVDNKQQLMHKNERYKVSEIGKLYANDLVRVGIAEWWEESKKIVMPKKVESHYTDMTVKELRAEAKDLEGYSAALKKKELIDLLENANR